MSLDHSSCLIPSWPRSLLTTGAADAIIIPTLSKKWRPVTLPRLGTVTAAQTERSAILMTYGYKECLWRKPVVATVCVGHRQQVTLLHSYSIRRILATVGARLFLSLRLLLEKLRLKHANGEFRGWRRNWGRTPLYEGGQSVSQSASWTWGQGSACRTARPKQAAVMAACAPT